MDKFAVRRTMMGRLYVICVATCLLLQCWTDSAEGRYPRNRKARKHKQGRSNAFHSTMNQGMGRADCSPNSTRQIPNVLEPMKIDPYRFLGRWYPYLRYYDGIEDDSPGSINSVYSFNVLAHETLHPATGSPAVLIEAINSVRDIDSGECRAPGPSLSYLTPEGAITGIGALDPTFYEVDNSVILATDYSYALFYQCSIYNVESGFCDDPFLYVFTRVRPDRLASKTIDTIGRIVNRLLSQYCVTIDMFFARLWTPSLGECPIVVPDDSCYQALRQAHLDLAGVSV